MSRSIRSVPKPHHTIAQGFSTTPFYDIEIIPFISLINNMLPFDNLYRRNTELSTQKHQNRHFSLILFLLCLTSFSNMASTTSEICSASRGLKMKIFCIYARMRSLCSSVLGWMTYKCLITLGNKYNTAMNKLFLCYPQRMDRRAQQKLEHKIRNRSTPIHEKISAISRDNR